MDDHVLLIFAIAFSFLFPLLGRKRRIGYGWGLVLCLFLSPIIGLIIIICSKKKSKIDFLDAKGKPMRTYRTMKVIGIILTVVWGIIPMLVALMTANYELVPAGLPIIVLGLFLIRTSAQKRKEEEERKRWEHRGTENE